MNCADFERNLNECFTASGLSETAELQRHAGECLACHETWERFRLLNDATLAWRKQVPDVDLTGAVVLGAQSQAAGASSAEKRPILKTISNGAGPRARHSAGTASIVARGPWVEYRLFSRRAAAISVAVFAAVSAAILTAFFWRGDAHVEQVTQSSLSQPKSSSDRLAERAVPRPGPSSRQVGQLEPPLYLDLAEQAAGALGEATAFVMPGASSDMSNSRHSQESAGEWIDGLQHQLRPIGRSLEDAFDFLWQAGESADRT